MDFILIFFFLMEIPKEATRQEDQKKNEMSFHFFFIGIFHLFHEIALKIIK